MNNPPLHPAALMVKDLKVNMRVTTVNHMFGMPVSIVEDFTSQTLTITSINASEGSYTGFDDLEPHTLVTKTFEECGITDGPEGWSTDVCTMPSEFASALHDAFIEATRDRPLNRQLVGVGQQFIPLLGK